MTNAFSMWTSWLDTGRMLGETLHAAQAVVASRSGTIAAASRDPLQADVKELTLMFSEKNKAFGKAGASMARDFQRMQSDMLAQAQALGSLWFGGPMMPAKAMAMLARSQRISDRALASSARALRPIHATATANQRRLGKKR